MTLRLLIHADRAPQFIEVVDKAPVRYRVGPPAEGTVSYEDMGKLRVPVEVDEYGSPLSVAVVRMFVHPDLLAEVRERGVYAPSPWGDLG